MIFEHLSQPDPPRNTAHIPANVREFTNKHDIGTPLILYRSKRLLYEKELLPWSDIEDVQDEDGTLIMKIRKKKQPYIIITSNAALIVVLVKHVMRSRLVAVLSNHAMRS